MMGHWPAEWSKLALTALRLIGPHGCASTSRKAPTLPKVAFRRLLRSRWGNDYASNAHVASAPGLRVGGRAGTNHSARWSFFNGRANHRRPAHRRRTSGAGEIAGGR